MMKKFYDNDGNLVRIHTELEDWTYNGNPVKSDVPKWKKPNPIYYPYKGY